ncbi:hypothetical protein SCUCBS95973_009034 [Sporothrix curviconia]|uniref:Uncharacterized protein n=1 Tax=Sporothrix curviconia TaxID=1260050 RepID=A0ABP0CRM3_9PEZI
MSVGALGIYLYCLSKCNAAEQAAFMDPACDPNINIKAKQFTYAVDYRPGRHDRHSRHQNSGSRSIHESLRQQSAQMYNMQNLQSRSSRSQSPQQQQQQHQSRPQQPTSSQHITFMERYRSQVYENANIPNTYNNTAEVPPPYTALDKGTTDEVSSQSSRPSQPSPPVFTVTAANERPSHIGRNSSIRVSGYNTLYELPRPQDE